MPLVHDPIRRLTSMPMPTTEAAWRRFLAQLALTIGFSKDQGTGAITVPDDTFLESRPTDEMVDVVGNLTGSGMLANAIEYESRPGVEARTVVQRIGDDGTGNDVRLVPVSKGANLGSAVVGSSPLTSSDAGADAEVTIAGFTVQFDFGTRAVSGGQITGLAYTTLYNIVLRGFSYATGAWTSATAETTDADTTDDENVFYVGSITTAAAAGPPTGGQGGGGHYDP